MSLNINQNVLEAAIYVASRGKPVFPCGPDKKPITKNGFKSATTDPDTIKEWFGNGHGSRMIGMPTGKRSGYTVLDIDVDETKGIDGNDSLFELEQQHEKIPDTPEVLTPRGGRHLYFQYVPGLRNSAGKLGPGLDIRSDGGYVIAPPSLTPDGKRYEWEASSNLQGGSTKFAKMPQWMIDLLKPAKSSSNPASKRSPAKKNSRHTEGSRNQTLASIAGYLRRKGLDPEVIEAALLAENTKSCDPPLDDAEVAKIARSIGRYDPESQQEAVPIPGPDEQPENWRKYLVYSSEETPKSKSQLNACIFLTHHPAARRVFALNEFSGKTTLTKQPPWDTVRDDYPRPISDADITLAVSWLERQGIFVSTAMAHSAITVSARHYAYDPLKQYIQGLTWDQRPRLTGWLSRFLGCPATRYVEAVGRRFLIGAVARAMMPGCKMDTMLILEGEQGAKKSTAISVLFSDEWFTDEIHGLGTKDAAMQLQGHWGVEISEMHAMSKAEASQIKEWITRRRDKYRPPYGRTVVESPRRCVLVGTLNPEGGYLKDATGARRFWPVECTTIDLEALENERDQLWAEAHHALQQGEQWWLTGKEEILAKQQQSHRYEDEPWGAVIDEYTDFRPAVTTHEIMEFALELNRRDWNRGTEMRIAKHLRQQGRKRKKVRLDVNQKLVWMYVTADFENEKCSH